MSRCLTYEVNGDEYFACPATNRQSYAVFPRHDPNERTTTVFREGSYWISSGHPGKKWKSMEQAIIYTVTMRE